MANRSKHYDDSRRYYNGDRGETNRRAKGIRSERTNRKAALKAAARDYSN